jgi:hypothetical protein
MQSTMRSLAVVTIDAGILVIVAIAVFAFAGCVR